MEQLDRRFVSSGFALLDILTHLFNLAGRQRLAQRRQVVGGHAGTRHVRTGPDLRVRFHEVEIFLVHIPVAHGVHESVDAGPEQVLGVFQPRRPAEMGEHLLAVGVGFRDDRAIHIRLQFRHCAVTIVDPDLHEPHASRVQLLNGFAALVCSRGAVRNSRASLAWRTRHRSCGDPFPYCQKTRRIRNQLVAQAIRELRIGLEPHAQRSRHAVVRVPLELVDEILARVVRLPVAAIPHVDEPDVVVAVDQRRDERLAGHIDPDSALRRLCARSPVRPTRSCHLRRGPRRSRRVRSRRRR